jgi:hypothetical protein
VFDGVQLKLFRGLTTKMWTYILTTAALFYALVPGVLLSLPPGSSFQVQALTHALVFALVHKFVQHGLLKQ